MSKSYYGIIKPLVEEELNICVVGYFSDYKQFHIESRHLGLMMPDEIKDIKEQLRKISEELKKTVSIERVIQIAEKAEELENEGETSDKEDAVFEEKERPLIAVARDEAFCFYYEDNLLLLEECGARIVFFSPLYDTQLPKDCNGILIGGGYPELYGEVLSRNTDMLSAIKQAMENGMPIVAECGGFMYLHSVLEDKEEKEHIMAGALPGKCHYTEKLVRFGYIELEENQSNFLPEGKRIRGHEFHYFDSEDNGRDCLAIKPVTGRSYPCVIEEENCFVGFPHLYYPSNPEFAKSFVRKAGEYKELV